MTPYENWSIDSQAAARFWRSVIAFEDFCRQVRFLRFRFTRWRLNRQYRFLPPICHRSQVFGEEDRL